MADDGKIYITISDKRFGKNKAEADEQNNIDKEQTKSENTLVRFATHKFFNLIETQAKQAVSYTINNIGNFTGDYTIQQHTQDSMQILGFLLDLGSAAVAGAKFGPWGAAIAVGTALIGKGITMTEQFYAGQVENNRQNRNIAQLRTRAGLNGTNNGSRGTDQ